MINSLDVKQLYNECDISIFDFETTNDLKLLKQPIGQKNAIEAVKFGTHIQQEGYNIFVMGASGSGKHSAVINFLEKKSKKENNISDWCYVNNFKNYQKPIIIKLKAGKAQEFKNDIDELIGLIKTILPSTFDSNEYRNEIEAINKKYVNMQSDIFMYLQNKAKEYEVSMNASNASRVTFVPIVGGKVLSPEEFNSIDAKKKKEIQKRMNEFEAIVKEKLREVSQLNKSLQKELKSHDKKVTQQAVGSLIDEVKHKYEENEKIVDYLSELQNDIINNIQDFLAKPENMSLPPFMKDFYTPSFEKYEVNLFISHEDNKNAPVIYEDNPTQQNLVGKIEHVSQVGTLVTNFSMIKPGALHKANGGYLILDARKLLTQPFAYEELKRVLRSKEIRIESLAQQYSFISTTSLEPEPIPLDVKVVLIGERMLYYLLYQYDPDFKELFKVSADFEDEMPRDEKNIKLYARMIGTISKQDNLLPLTPEAVSMVIEQSSRNISNSLKLSTHLRTLSDILKEADYYSRELSHEAIEKKDIEKALKAQNNRKNRIQTKLYDLIDDGTLMIDLSGDKVGQINALSYISIGGHNFGTPSRITATTRIGKGEIIDIERKVDLGGPIHSKGVMILSSYLGYKYAKDIPLSLNASLVFEQSYGMIDGDSASSTELYAILSSLSGLSIKQNIAVTGSVNQFGEIQPIGGVNEKIEGFFDICMRNNPRLSYAVIIPKRNVKNLMLKNDVLKAVKAKKFAIYAVESIDEGIEILTGVKASNVNDLVTKRVRELSLKVKEFYKSTDSEKN
ncbi:AAA family ATPase [Sulfurimonas lithotrophica]|uniref:endopeptidase La n=1 Tax=Sulfurimonas lithotrophica TaxID=2590022 RepID=A0A5P8P1S0_9BACT|nr:ATP-binding protein [Sulfurimonas lithotrophica]QFR49606.1 AAA family ATPase [Sulfurimonas lithotrophica]